MVLKSAAKTDCYDIEKTAFPWDFTYILTVSPPPHHHNLGEVPVYSMRHIGVDRGVGWIVGLMSLLLVLMVLMVV